jgi:hypothetical protein
LLSPKDVHQNKLVTTAYDPEQGGFPHDPLAHIDGGILHVIEHFFIKDETPQVLLIVHHRPGRTVGEPRPAAQAVPSRMRDAGPRAELSEPERACFDRLRAWRNGRAQVDGVPPYVLLTNRQLAEIVRRQPTTIAELREIGGIGEAKTGRFGKDLLSVLTPGASAPAASSPRVEADVH